MPSNVTAGDLLIVTVGNQPAASAVTVTVSDTLNGSFTQAGTSCFSAYDAQSTMFYFAHSAAGADTITATLPASASISVDAQEYSGIATSSPLDVAPLCGTLTAGAHPATPSITTVTANDLIVAAAPFAGNTGTLTVSSPYTIESPSGFGGMAYQSATAATSYTGATFTIQYSGGNVIAMIAAFKPAGGGSTYHPPGHGLIF